jgi:hypothetical protein
MTTATENNNGGLPGVTAFGALFSEGPKCKIRDGFL